MKYLRVEYSGNKKSFVSIEDLAKSIKECYPNSVSSVEICDDEEPKFPEIKKSEVGVLDINIPDKFYISDNSMSFYDGDPVDLEHYPELRSFCKDIKSTWNFDEIPEGALIEVSVNYADKSYYGIFTKYDNVNLDFCYVVKIDRIKSIRIVEVKK